MYYLGTIELAPDESKSNKTTAAPFSLDGWPAIALEPSGEGLSYEICRHQDDPEWETTTERGARLSAAGTVPITIPIMLAGHVLSIANSTDATATVRVWGLYR